MRGHGDHHLNATLFLIFFVFKMFPESADHVYSSTSSNQTSEIPRLNLDSGNDGSQDSQISMANSNEVQLIDQAKLNDLIRILELTKEQSIVSNSSIFLF